MRSSTSMMIMYELNSLFQNMNTTFSQADFLLPQLNDMNVPFAAAKQGGKFRGPVGGCRNGLSKSNTEVVTRKKHSKEVEFERKSSQCQFQEQESDRYKIMNLLHQVNATKKTVDNDDVVRHCEETTETNIFILEKRYDAVPGRVVQMFWTRLKRLVGAGSSSLKGLRLSPPKAAGAAVTTSKAGEETTSSCGGGGGGGGGGCSSGNTENAVGLVVGGGGATNKPSLDEIALNTGNGDDASSSIGAMKKKRNFFKKLVAIGRRNEASAAAGAAAIDAAAAAAAAHNENSNVFEPIRSVSDIVNDVQSKNRMLELIDANKKGMFLVPQVECRANQQSVSDVLPDPDQNTVKKFFIMKFILARKKPSIQT